MKRVAYACLLAFVLAACAPTAYAQLAGSCWPKFHKDVANTGLGAYGGTGSDLTWTFTAGGPIRSAPIVGVDGTTYFACDDGKLYAVGGDGTERWHFTCNCQGAASPALGNDGTIYLGTGDKYVFAVRPTGTLKWKRLLTERVDSSVSIASDGTIVCAGIDGKVYGLNPSDGSNRWVYTAAGAVRSSPAIGPDGSIYFGCQDGAVYALYSNGTLKWKFTAPGSNGFSAAPVIGSDGTVYIGCAAGFFYAVRNNGTQRWRQGTGAEIKSCGAIGPNGNIVVGSRDHKLYAFNATGLQQWTFTAGHYIDSSPAVGVDGGIYFGSSDGVLYSLNPDGSERWRYAVGSPISSSPAIGPAGALLVGADNGVLYCFAADDTPPFAPVVTDDGAYTSLLTSLHASWSATDPESGIFSYEYCIGTAPGLADVAPWLNVGSATQHTRTGLNLQDAVTYYVTARAINGAGLPGSEGSSDGIIADATPPTIPVVTDSGRFTSNATSLQASWTASDPQSGIAGYQYSIGTSPGATNVLTWTDAGMATSVTRTGLVLQGGTTYYFNVKALNTGGAWGAAGSSDGITVDVTPPATPTVTDAGQFISDEHSIWASWVSSDNESGVTKFEYSVGTSAGATNVLGWTDAGTNTAANITGLNLTNGATYYVNVRATNGALLVSAVGSSDGAILDVTPPPAPTVTDDGDYTASTTQLHATWTVSDGESGIASYRYAIGTAPGAADLAPWTDNGTNTSVTRTGLSLTHQQVYYISVIAINGAQAQSAVGTSDGIIVDATPPTRPAVSDDGAYTASATDLHATWDASDPESGIGRYEYSIGTSPGATDTANWTDVGQSKSVTRTGLALHDGQTYYINVRAYNTVGVVSEVGSSNGIIVDLQTPPAPTVTDDGVFTATGTSLHAAWSAVTCPSGVAGYEYSIGTSAGGTEVRNWTSVGSVTTYTATGLSLQSGGVYYFNVRARNTLGKAGAVGFSDGITVDLTAPPAPSVTDAGAWWASSTQLTANWSCSDPESGIIEFFYAVGTTAHDTQVRGWTSAGTNTSLTIEGLSLTDGQTYYISVKAKNGAGTTGADGTTDGIRLDLTPPTKPTVTDDGNYTTDATQLHAAWSSTDPQSGITRYEYCVGTAAGAADTRDWTSAGTATDLTITGLALEPGIRYYISVRAFNGAGSMSEAGSSDGIFVESTPPTTPVVTDDGQYTQSTTTLRASWSAEDPETGVARFEYCVGTEAGLDDLVGWTDAGLATSFERTNLSLEQGRTYYVSVRATNGIGLVSEVGSSDGITVDTTGPGEPTVTSTGYTSSTSELQVSLECSDDESGIASYECAVGTTAGATDVADWTDVGPGPNAVIAGLILEHGHGYYVSARAINGAGITGPTGTSEAIIVDTTGPVDLVVTDGGAYTGFDDRIHASWSASDPESGIASYRYCVGTAAGKNDVADWLDVGAATEHTREGLALSSGTTYYITVIATNRAGSDSAPASSDGIRLDLTPPSTPTVTDTGQYWGYKTSIYGTWHSEDAESGIVEYQMSVGTSAGATDVADWVSVGNSTSYTRTGLHLSDGVTYYINIKARNGAGRWSEVASSDGVMIDSTPPITPVVIDDGDTQATLDSLHATWHSEDPESGIAEYFYCIGTSPGATDVLAWTSAGQATSATVADLQLDPVLRYYFSVKARSNAGAWSAVSASDGIGYTSGAAIWAKFRNDQCNNGRGLFNATRIMDLAWSIPTQGYVESSPAIAADGTAYIGSADGKVYAITQNGTIRWTYDAGSPIDSSPSIAPDRSILTGCADGRVLCLRPSGELAWSYQTNGPVHACALVVDQRAYISSTDGGLYALDLATGQRVWRYATGGAIRSSAATDGNGSIYVASGDGYIYALNTSGTLRWRYHTGSAVDASPAIAADGTVYVGSGDGYMYALRADGTMKWRFQTNTLVDSSAAIGPDGTVYFGGGYDGGDGRLFALKPDGTKIWRLDLPGGGVVSSPAIDPSGMIYVGACDSKLYAINPDGSVRWAFPTGSSVVSSPALGADSSIVFGSYDGSVYCLRDITSKDLTPPTTPVVTVGSAVLPLGAPLTASWTATDPDTMVAEYTYAVGTAPGEADVSGWLSAGIETSVSRDDLALEVGRTYYVSVKARNPSQRWSEIGVSEGVRVVPSGTVTGIGDLKSRGPGFGVELISKVVTAVFEDCFFIEEPKRIAGVRCIADGADLQPGDRVNVTGTLARVNGELAIDGAIYAGATPGDVLSPIGINGRAIGVAGPDPLGLYVTICGPVTGIGDGYAVVDVGGGVQSARGCVGIEVWSPGFTCAVGDSVRATGVLCREQVNGQEVVVLRTCPDSEPVVVSQ